jgi:hypothetical protein
MSIRSLATSLPRQALGAAQGAVGFVRGRLPGGEQESPAASAPLAAAPVATAPPQPAAPAPRPPAPKAAKPKAKAAKAPKAKPAKAAKAKAAGPKATKPAKPKASRPKAAKAAKPKAAKPKPGPHHELNNPVVDDPDPTEWPDPYDQREDPRGPDSGGIPGATSTSEPHPAEELEPDDRRAKAKRDKLDK